ncbi:hypothetical protein C1A20_00070 (plasmid) [Escherichia coli]|nr:hypothetical protein C1A20_00070 [Escherichia coli]EEW1531756.1 hypothetical protein [Escherichia coli]EFE7797440.1 hypothetical protein [Escherichia coli]MCH7061484.1 hypothetical protein [Escherichia coli]MHY33426.1 hypothetical protein [Escherichia coli]
MGGFPHSTGARQGGRIPTRHRRAARWADSHTAPARGKVGGFPHSTGARQGGRIPTRHRRAARWADSHTAPARGKVGGFPHGTGARQGGRISTRHRRPARWADSHIDMYVACVICGLCSSAGRWSYGGVSPVTGRVRPLTRSTAPRPADGPPFPRAALRTPVGDVRQLRGGERD